ncbi:MAG: nucleoside deaminase [Candidatus Acidiferrales bacterium]
MPRDKRGHEAYMKRAIELAKIARSKGETPVGSLAVRDGEIVAEGIEAVKTRIDISAHAEMIAIRRACRALGTLDLSGCVIHTTPEPCFMCSYAIRQTRISEIVIGRPEPTYRRPQFTPSHSEQFTNPAWEQAATCCPGSVKAGVRGAA